MRMNFGTPHEADPRNYTQRAIMQLFEAAGCVNGDIDYQINVSMIEIYNEKIRDLLSPSVQSSPPLSIRMGEDGRLSIPGLREVV
ncbi:hypothetical protein OSTOST_25137 [Ostertagia ostertagi]